MTLLRALNSLRVCKTTTVRTKFEIFRKFCPALWTSFRYLSFSNYSFWLRCSRSEHLEETCCMIDWAKIIQSRQRCKKKFMCESWVLPFKDKTITRSDFFITTKTSRHNHFLAENIDVEFKKLQFAWAFARALRNVTLELRAHVGQIWAQNKLPFICVR